MVPHFLHVLLPELCSLLFLRDEEYFSDFTAFMAVTSSPLIIFICSAVASAALQTCSAFVKDRSGSLSNRVCTS